MGRLDFLQARGISRRDFMKLMAATTAALGLPEVLTPQAAKAVEAAIGKTPCHLAAWYGMYWLQ